MAPQVELPDILHEQLEYLIAHAARNAQCGCSECQRYLRVRSALLEIFAEPQGSNVQEIVPQLAKAA